MLKDRLNKVTLLSECLTIILCGILVLHVVGKDSPIKLGLTGQFEWSRQIRLVKAWEDRMAEVSLKASLEVLLAALFCGKSGETHTIQPVHVEKVQLDGVFLVEK